MTAKDFRPCGVCVGDLWKNADPDIPIYQQAKAEYANLRK